MSLKSLLSALVVAAGLLVGAAPALACATAASQADCCPHGSPCSDGAGSATVCCAAPVVLPGAPSSATRAGLDERPDTGSFPVALIPAWPVNFAPAADAGRIVLAGESLLFRDSQPVYLRTNRLRL